MLTQPEEGKYFLEDLVTRLPLDLSNAVRLECMISYRTFRYIDVFHLSIFLYIGFSMYRSIERFDISMCRNIEQISRNIELSIYNERVFLGGPCDQVSAGRVQRDAYTVGYRIDFFDISNFRCIEITGFRYRYRIERVLPWFPSGIPVMTELSMYRIERILLPVPC